MSDTPNRTATNATGADHPATVMGRPPFFRSVDDLLSKNIEGFADWCAEHDHQLLWEWFAVYLGCAVSTLDRFKKMDGYDAHGNYDATQDFSSVLEKIQALLQATMVENAVTGKWRDACAIFYMKNRGYTDRHEINADLAVNVQLGSMGSYAE